MARLAYAIAIGLILAFIPTTQAGETGVTFEIGDPVQLDSIPVVPCVVGCLEEDDTGIYLHTSVVRITWTGTDEVCPIGQPPCAPGTTPTTLLNLPAAIATSNPTFEPGPVGAGPLVIEWDPNVDAPVQVFELVDAEDATLYLDHFRQTVTVYVYVDGAVTPVPVPIDYFVPSDGGNVAPPCGDCGGGQGGGGGITTPDNPLDCNPVIIEPTAPENHGPIPHIDFDFDRLGLCGPWTA